MKLTDVALQKLRPNSRNDFIVQGRTGLIVRAAPSNGGTKIQFRYRWKKEGKTSVVTLGEYPDLSIKDANALHGLCAQASGQPYGEPKAVVEEWRRKRAPAVFEPGAGPTIKQAVTKWLTDYAEKARKRPEDVRRLLESNVCTKPIGAIPVASATRAHFNDAFMEIVERGAPVTSTRVRDALKQVFTFCADIEFTDRIPPMPKGKPGGKEKPRDRVLSDTEIRILWHGLDILSPVGKRPILGRPFAIALKLLLLTGARRGELSAAKWSDVRQEKWLTRNVDGEMAETPVRTWTVTENKSDHRPLVLGLPPLACTLLDELQGLAPAATVWMPSRETGDVNKERGRSILDASKTARTILGMAYWRPHDLRRTQRTILSRVGVPSEIAERVINHQSGNKMELVYDQHRYQWEIRDALIKSADFIERIVRDPLTPEEIDAIAETIKAAKAVASWRYRTKKGEKVTSKPAHQA